MILRLKQYYYLGPWLLFVLAYTFFRWLETGTGGQMWLAVNLWGILSFIIAWLTYHAIRIYPLEAGLMGYTLFIGLAGGALLCLTHYYWLQQSDFYAGDRHELIALLLVFSCWSAFHCAYVRRNRILSEDLRQQQSAASLHREAALYNLRQQLQPHFLYNSLNSINALIALSPKEAQKMVVRLSDFLRSSVGQDGVERIELSAELSYLQNYLDIELIRFGHRLQIEWKVTAPENATLPPLLLQPLLENAIKYGLYGMEGEVIISLSIALEDTMLLCRITNPFNPEQQAGQGTGFGLQGLQQRLQLLFARADLLHISRTDKEFTATLKIPQL